jgi:vacuolar-type H+-ATPase subunit H
VSSHEDPTGSLGSVRQLEAALEGSSTARAAAETRLREARSEAARLITTAKDEIAGAVLERRRSVLDAANDEVAEIHREGEAAAARLRVDARKSCEAMVAAALRVILPVTDEAEV